MGNLGNSFPCPENESVLRNNENRKEDCSKFTTNFTLTLNVTRSGFLRLMVTIFSTPNPSSRIAIIAKIRFVCYFLDKCVYVKWRKMTSFYLHRRPFADTTTKIYPVPIHSKTNARDFLPLCMYRNAIMLVCVKFARRIRFINNLYYIDTNFCLFVILYVWNI